MPQRLEVHRSWLVGAAVALAGLVVTTGLVWGLAGGGPTGSSTAPPVASSPPPSSATRPASPTPTGPVVLPSPSSSPSSSGPARRTLPGGRTTVFGDRHFLVAYYGTAGTGALGVLGETDPDTATRRLARAARPFVGRGERAQLVYELIVTVADAHPGRGGDYNHDIPRRLVQRYIDAAHRHGALLLLDVQPGRTHFLTVARRWEWALRDPWVGLALDPEWRMGPRQVPARVIGSVGAAEVNRTADWLAALTRRHRLPQKLFVLHQFRTSMIRDIGTVRRHRELAMVQHVDGFGTPGQKLGTFHAVLRPRLFTPGFKLFYDEDRRLMSARAVRAIRPPVRFVSFQ